MEFLMDFYFDKKIDPAYELGSRYQDMQQFYLKLKFHFDRRYRSATFFVSTSVSLLIAIFHLLYKIWRNPELQYAHRIISVRKIR